MSKHVSNEKKEGLDLKALTSIAVGTVVGAGVVSLVTVGASMTGKSVWLAYLAAILLGFCLIIPFIFLGSMIRVKGGNYTLVAEMLGDVWGGMYSMAFTMYFMSSGMMGISISMYLKAIFPFIPIIPVAVLVLTLFFCVNLLGVNFLAKVQKYMSMILILGLGTFIIMGLLNINMDVFNIKAPDFFFGGNKAFLGAVILFVFSTNGHSNVVTFSKEAKNPKRDIPLAIIITTCVITVIYTCVAVVSAGIVPIAELQGKTLAVIAAQIMPAPLYFAFIIGGPIMALMTTLNAGFTIFTRPLYQATQDGWFPKGFGVTNKYDAPYLIMGLIYLVATIPVVIGFDMRVITNNAVLIQYLVQIIALVAILKLPNKIEGAWDKRYFKFSKPVFYIGMIISFIAEIFVIYISAKNLTPKIVIFSIGLLVALYLYAHLRQKKGCVHMEKSYDLGE